MERNYSLLNNNTFGIDVKASMYAEYDSVDALRDIIASNEFRTSAHLQIGGGSNLLFLKDFDGMILHSRIKGIEVLMSDSRYALVKVGAGEIWDDFVAWCVANNLGGAENLSGIPGEVGATPVQNIGAYGAEVKELIDMVETVEIATGDICMFTAADCHFGYRNSIFKKALKGKYIVTSVLFKLKQPSIWRPDLSYGGLSAAIDGEPTLAAIREAVICTRNSKLPDPKVLGNAGSFFMNPVVDNGVYAALKEKYPSIPGYVVSETQTKVPAGWLIEQAGWKGRSLGPAAVHDRQALVLVNRGGASGSDIVELCNAVCRTVFEKFGIKLHPEVNFI